MAKGLFISHANFLSEGGGGAQVCTREFIETIKTAGVDLTLLPFGSDRRLSTRLRRLINSSPFIGAYEPGLPARIAEAAAKTKFDFVFLNQVVLASLGPSLRTMMPSAKIVVLSHGLEHVDMLHIVRARETLPVTSRMRPTPALLLGRVILEEQRTRRHIDGVCAISPFDADLEEWLGTRNVIWVPRTITPQPLDWKPVPGRLGFVGTLDHAPNLEGLAAVLEVMARQQVAGLTVRIVGASGIAEWLRAKYPHVEVCGPLDDAALAVEAASWTAFLHPIFYLPRGASTKLALGMSWEIPIVTTPQGRRGYLWEQGGPLEAKTPEAFVAACQSLDTAAAQHLREDVRRATASSPTIPAIATRMQAFLSAL